MRIRLTSAMLICALGSLHAQTSINILSIIPAPTHSAVGEVRLWDKAQDFYTGLAGADTITANVHFRMPTTDGSAGNCMATDGAGNLSLTGICGSLTPPVTISGTTSSAILTLTQSGTGNTLETNGPVEMTGTHSGTTMILGIKDLGDVPGINFIDHTNAFLSSITAGATAAFDVSASAIAHVFTIHQDGTSHIVLSSTGDLLSVSQSGSGNALNITGSVTGNHLQNLGAGDSPTFNNLTVSTTAVLNALKVGGVGGGDFFTFQVPSTHRLLVGDSSANPVLDYRDASGFSTGAFFLGGSIIPASSGTYDLGSASPVESWRDLYMTGTVHGNIAFSGFPTFSNNVTFGGSTAATFNGLATFNNQLTANFATVGGLTINSSGTLTISSGSVLSLNSGTSNLLSGSLNITSGGSLTGVHGQNIGTGDNVTFNFVVGSNGMGITGWNFIDGSANMTAASYSVGATAGVTSTTCSQFTKGICTAP